MGDPQAFDTQVRAAYDRWAGEMPTDVDALALVRATRTDDSIHELSTTAGSGRYPRRPPAAGPGQDQTGRRRSRTMFNALKVAAAVAIITVGGFAASRVVPGPWQGTGAPGVEAPSVAEDWAFFTGMINKEATGDFPALSEPFTENGLSIDLGGWGLTAQTIVSDDPRMTGTRSVRYHVFTDTWGGGEVAAILETIETDAGAWTCPLIQLGVPGGGDSKGGWCEGAGGYAGLRAYIAMGEEVSPSAIGVFGFMTSADGLPFPEAPAN